MRSLIAALRTLTLPFGATSGPRIILDGVNGRIEIYSNAGNLLMTLDDDGLRVFDADGDLRQALGLITDFSSIQFADSNGEHSAFIAYSPIPGADDYRAMQYLAPRENDDPTLSRLLIVTPHNSLTKNPLFQWDTGFLDPDGAQPIADFCGFTSSGPLKAMLVASEYRVGTSNGGANAPTVGDSLVRAGDTTPKIQYGVEAVDAVSGTNNGSDAVTFDDPFSTTPVIVCTLRQSGTRAVCVEARNPSTTGFDAFWKTADLVNLAANVTFNINWMAIETAPIP